MVMIDHYTKMAHFEPVTLKGTNKNRRISAEGAAKVARRRIFRQHGIPKA